jgi:hypothetical protein
MIQIKALFLAAAVGGALLVGLGSGFAGGHYVAKVAGEREAARLVQEFGKERTAFQGEKVAWANERADMNRRAFDALSNEIDKARRAEEEMRKQFASTEKKYQARIKELENARKQADSIIDNPGPDGGLWASVDRSSCYPPGGDSNAADLSKAAGAASGTATTLRCRLTTPTAQALVEMMDQSDKHTELLNRCIGLLNAPLKILNPT